MFHYINRYIKIKIIYTYVLFLLKLKENNVNYDTINCNIVDTHNNNKFT